MFLKLDDGKAIFATHFLRCAVNREDEQMREALAPFQVEADGVVCYSQAEADAARAALDNLGIPCTVEPQVIDQTVRDKAAGVRYGSRSEAVRHLVEGVAPPDEALAEAIANATTLNELKGALLGKLRPGRVKGRPI